MTFIQQVCQMGVYACLDVPSPINIPGDSNLERHIQVEEATNNRIVSTLSVHTAHTALYMQRDLAGKFASLHQEPGAEGRLLGTYRLMTLCERIARRVEMYVQLDNPQLRAVVTGTTDRDITAIVDAIPTSRPDLSDEAADLEGIMRDPDSCATNEDAHRALHKWLRKHNYDEAADIANDIAWHQGRLAPLLNGNKKGLRDE